MKILYLFIIIVIVVSTFASSYADADKNCVGMLQKLDSMLNSKVPEISDLANYISESTKNTAQVIIYINHCPNPNSGDTIKRDCYEMYVGESGYIWYKTHNRYHDNQKPSKRLFSFFIKSDLSKIFVYDTKKKTYLTIQEARQSKNWKNALEQKKQWVDSNLK